MAGGLTRVNIGDPLDQFRPIGTVGAMAASPQMRPKFLVVAQLRNVPLTTSSPGVRVREDRLALRRLRGRRRGENLSLRGGEQRSNIAAQQCHGAACDGSRHLNRSPGSGKCGRHQRIADSDVAGIALWR